MVSALAVLAGALGCSDAEHVDSPDDTSGTGGAGVTGGTAGSDAQGGSSTGAAAGTTGSGGSGSGAAGAAAGETSGGAAGSAAGGVSGSSSGLGGTAGNGALGGDSGTGGAMAGSTSGGGAGGVAGSAGTNVGGGGSGSGASGGNAGSSGSGGGAGTGGSSGGSGCPVNLVGFATVEGGTTGGGNAAPTTVRTQAELRACATASGPRVCRVQGTVTFNPFEEIRVTSDKTIIGTGASAELVMGGFFLASGVRNVIIQNLTFRDSYVEGQNDEGGDEGGDRDGVQMDTAHHVWIDHCRFRNLGDGLIDSRRDTTFLTVSWNVLENHDKTFGIGWTENVSAQMTIHHNWFRGTNQRNPSTDNVLRAHLFNNLLENVTAYGNYARGGTNMVLQNSVFSNVKDPHYYDTGTLVAIGNVYRNTTGQQESSGTSFSFFDPAAFYSYTLDSATDAEAVVRRCAGPRAELGN